MLVDDEVTDAEEFAAADSPPATATAPRITILSDVLRHMRQNLVFWAGLLAFVVPTMVAVARHGWTTDQGAHAPIVLATGFWVVGTLARDARAAARPGNGAVVALLLIPSLLLYAAARITGLIEIEGVVMYAALIAILYSLGGQGMLKVLWFPLVYFLFLFPPPQSLVDTLTQPVKILISSAAVDLLDKFGYPIAGSGVSIFIGQFELLIAAACAGLNSLISLTAIGIFYIYILHSANWRYTLVLMLAVVPVAILANFIRVLILVLTTYYFGEATAQGFLHEFAGLTMFVIAVLTIFLIDRLATPLRRRLERKNLAL